MITVLIPAATAAVARLNALVAGAALIDAVALVDAMAIIEALEPIEAVALVETARVEAALVAGSI